MVRYSLSPFPPFIFISMSDDLNMLYLLLAVGCDPNTLSQQGDTPLMLSLQQTPPSMEILRLLVSFGSDVSIANPYTANNALHIISQKKGVNVKALHLLYTANNAMIARQMKNQSGSIPDLVMIVCSLHSSPP
jgi:hypothetical protein